MNFMHLCTSLPHDFSCNLCDSIGLNIHEKICMTFAICECIKIKRKLKAQFQLENQQLLLKDHFCLLPQYPTCMLSTNFCEYACLYQSSYYHKHRVNPLHVHIEYIAWYIIMFEATHQRR